MKKLPTTDRHSEAGWATLEIVMLMPLIVGLIGVIFYFGQLSFLRLHLTSVVDAAARVASIEGCERGEGFISQSFSNLQSAPHIECNKIDDNTHIQMSTTIEYHSSLPFFELIRREITVKTIVLNEKQWEEEAQ